MNTTAPFWETRTPSEFAATEWEAVCDGCAKCCLHKLEDDDTGEVRYTSVACRLLDLDTCRCRDYENRHRLVPDCLKLDASSLDDCRWLPETCAYRRLAEGAPLPPWHPLRSARRSSVHEAGVSIRAWAIPEEQLDPEDDLTDYAVGRL